MAIDVKKVLREKPGSFLSYFLDTLWIPVVRARATQTTEALWPKTCPLIQAPLLLCPLCEKSYNHIEAEKIRELFTQGLNEQQIAERLDIGRALVFCALT